MNVQTKTDHKARRTERAAPQEQIDISVISISSATERRRATSAMLDGHDLKWCYFDAHTTLACEDLRYDAAVARRHSGTALAPQQIAVYSSHYAVWKAFVNAGTSEYLLVLEDDLILDMEFPLKRFAAFCAKFDMDYVRLFGKHYAPAAHLGFFFDRSLLRFTTSPTGAQAYFLSIKGARNLLECCRGIDRPVDLAMDRFWVTGLPLYTIFPYPVIERYVPTSIPIPAFRGKSSSMENLTWNLHRVIHKIRKIRENRTLSRLDKRIRLEMPAFHQILGDDKP
jgi:glycosyl transferase, family 25